MITEEVQNFLYTKVARAIEKSSKDHQVFLNFYQTANT